MKKYYVKSLFSGWCEVTEENYRAYIEHLRKGSSAVPQEKKNELIARRTKVVDCLKEDTHVSD